MMEKSKCCKILDISDLHIGVSKVHPIAIRNHLMKYVYPHINKDLFMVILNGDFFHTQLTMNGDAGITAGLIINDLIQLCVTNGVYLRVLRGTYSHDRNQNEWFLIGDTAEIKLGNQKLIDVISTGIYFEVLQFQGKSLSILYIPDNLPFEDVTQAAVDLMESSNMKFDFIVTHGYYEHHLPKGLLKVPQNLLYQDKFLPYLNGYILNGHIHTSSLCKRVLTIGSFERFVHGEEESKGCYSINYGIDTHNCIFNFICNKGATIFHTIDLVDCNTFEQALEIVNQDLNKLPIAEKKEAGEQLYIRIISDNLELKQAVEVYLKEKYSNMLVSSVGLHTKNQIEEIATMQDNELPEITPANLPSMIKKNCSLPLTEEQIQGVLDGTI